MPNKILMPALSPTMTEGKLSKWVKKEGDIVEAGDVIAEIETDKATMEVEAIDDGTLAKIYVAEGTEGVAVNTLIAVLLEDGESLDDVYTNSSENAAPAKAEALVKEEVKIDTKVQVASSDVDGNRIFVSPLAKRIAKDKGIDLSAVKGSGPKGRIIKADLDKAPSAIAKEVAISATAAMKAAPSSGINAIAMAEAFNIPYEAVPNSMMRKTIAKRLLESKQTVPHYYLTVHCEIDKMMEVRKQVNDGANGAYKVSVNDFIIKAAALAQIKVPDANVAWHDEATLKYKRSDVSVAVSTPNGLITPIIKDATNKSLKEISIEIKELAKKAREGKLQPEDYQGGTMTVSNLGMYGMDEFTAIINPPQGCILAVGAGTQRAVVKNGVIVPAMVMTATASLDHRAIDGATGAKYLSEFKKLIEDNPVALLL